MKVLLDIHSFQVVAHIREKYNHQGEEFLNPSYHKRLISFLQIVKDVDNTTEIIYNEITTENLREVDAIFILTRIMDFSEEQLISIIDFLQRGGRLLLMSNHAPHAAKDNILGELLNVNFSGSYSSGSGKYTKIMKENFEKSSSIFRDGHSRCEVIYSNTMCRIETPENWGEPLVYLPTNLISRKQQESDNNLKELLPHQRLFAVGFDGKTSHHKYIKSKALFVADSGFFGEKGADFPGYGMIEEGDNRNFLKILLEYVLL